VPFHRIVDIKDFSPSFWLRNFLGPEHVKLLQSGQHPLARGFAALRKRAAGESLSLNSPGRRG